MLQRIPTHQITAVSRWVFNSYLIEDGGAGRPFVVDAGIPANSRVLLSELVGRLGRLPGELALVVATHGHADHVGGTPMLLGVTGAPLYMHARVRDYMDGERPRIPDLRRMLRIMPVLSDQRFDPVAVASVMTVTSQIGYTTRDLAMPIPVEDFLVDGQELPGAPEWEVLHTPGHTDDSISLYNSRTKTLCSGDAVLTCRGRAWFNPEYCDSELAAATEERLRSLRVDCLLPGHGRPLVGEDLMSAALGWRDLLVGWVPGTRLVLPLPYARKFVDRFG